MDIDYKELFEQEKEAKEYLSDILTEFFMSDKNSHHMLGSIHSFYQIGVSSSDAVKWLKSMQRIDNNE